MDEKIKVINLGFVNCYLVAVNGGFILVDTGGCTVFDTNLPKIRAKLVQALDEAGCGSGNLKLVIITHGHLDHTGNGSFLKEKYGVKIAIHKLDSAMVNTAENPKMNFRKKTLLSGFFMMLFKPALKKMQDLFELYNPDYLIDENFDLKNFGWNARILHFGGHTNGSIGILTEEGDFFCGDIFTGDKKPSVTALADNFPKLDAAAERIKKLPAKTIYPGHGRPFLMTEILASGK